MFIVNVICSILAYDQRFELHVLAMIYIASANVIHVIYKIYNITFLISSLFFLFLN